MAWTGNFQGQWQGQWDGALVAGSILATLIGAGVISSADLTAEGAALYNDYVIFARRHGRR